MKTIDIKTFSDQLHEDMKTQLETIAQENQEIITRASKSLTLIKSCLNKLRDFVYQYQFQDKKEEIEFFKEIKPVFASQYYYYDRIISMKVNEPFGGLDALKSFYFLQLEQLQKFVKHNQEFYRYCLSNSTHFDDKYFTREDSPLKGFDVDIRFSTGFDTVLALILACQMLKDHLIDLIKKLSSEFSEISPSLLAWTGTKSDLVELIYALQSSEAINNGKADIRQIAQSFEAIFNISLGNYYRRFQEIRLRKNGKTNFLDQMKEKLEQRLDDFA